MYVAYLDALIESSTKLAKLGELLDNIHRRSKKAIIKDKMIIAMHLPTILGILYLWFLRFRKEKAIVILALISISKRTTIINGFYNKTTKSSKFHKGDIAKLDVLLGTIAIIGTSLNITFANNFVLFNLA